MEKTFQLLCKLKFAGLFLCVSFSSTHLASQSDTLIIGYKDGTTHMQKAILPTLLNMETVDSLLIFNQYKYVLPDVINITELDISDSLRTVLLSEFGPNDIIDAEEKKRVARKTSKEEMAGAEGSDLNLEFELILPDNYISKCADSHCINRVITPFSSRICNLSDANKAVKVGVLDTGVDPSIPHNVYYDCVLSPNAMPTPSPARDLHNKVHGTKVAEEILAASCCSDSTELVAIRILNSTGFGYLWDMLKGIAIAINEDVCVLNISAGFTDETTFPPGIKRPLEKAIEIAGNYGVLVVTSAGNASDNNDLLPHFPSNYSNMDHVIAVGSSCEGSLEVYSNFGQTSVTLTTEGDYSLIEKGTSYAAAVVSGFAALLQVNTHEGTFCEPIELKDIIVANTNSELLLSTTAGGELMPYETLLAWLPPAPPPIPLVVPNGENANLAPVVYPSPFEDEFSIELVLETDAIVEFLITNLNGERISQTKMLGLKNSNIWTFDDLYRHAPGIYLLQIKINGNSYNQKIVKL